jgi:hypothetical protein
MSAYDPKRTFDVATKQQALTLSGGGRPGSIVCGRGNGGIIHSQGEFFPQLSRESNLKIVGLFLQFFADSSENSGTVMIDELVGELPTVVSKIA